MRFLFGSTAAAVPCSVDERYATAVELIERGRAVVRVTLEMDSDVGRILVRSWGCAGKVFLSLEALLMRAR